MGLTSVNALPDLAPALGALVRDAGGALLALDASAAVGSIAVATRAGVLERDLDPSSMPSESMASAVAGALATADVAARDLRGIVVGLGPGSFTGLRVALATVKGLAYGLDAPVYGVSSLALVAAGAGPGAVAPVLDARRGDVFCALYEVGADGVPAARIDDEARTPAAFAALLERAAPAGLRLVGFEPAAFPELAALSAEAVIPTPSPRAAAGLLLAGERIRARAGEDLATLVPRYLRVSEAERVLRGKHS